MCVCICMHASGSIVCVCVYVFVRVRVSRKCVCVIVMPSGLRCIGRGLGQRNGPRHPHPHPTTIPPLRCRVPRFADRTVLGPAGLVLGPWPPAKAEAVPLPDGR